MEESTLSFLEDVWLYIVMKDGEIKNMDPEHFRKMSWVMDVRKKAISYQAHNFITKEEYDRLYQMSFASIEDLTLALEITRNLCEQHGMLTPRLRYCKIKTAEDEGVH